jgi:hypothetical protein
MEHMIQLYNFLLMNKLQLSSNNYYVQWNLDSSFLSGSLKKNDGYEKTMRGAYIEWIKTVTFAFAYVYLLNQKTYTNDIISTVKSNLHYLFLKKVINPHLFSITSIFQSE